MVCYHCCAPDCNSDTRKFHNLEKYPWMSGVTFHSFPHKTREAKARKLWIEKVRRGGAGDSFVVTKYTRICSMHFFDGKPTIENPFPTLFTYNNFKKPKRARATHNSTPDTHPRRADVRADGLSHSGVAAAARPASSAAAGTPTPPPTLRGGCRALCAAKGSRNRSVLCVPETCVPPIGSEVEISDAATSKRQKLYSKLLFTK